MKILLDTCSFLWIISGDSHLSKKASDFFSSLENEIFLSPVSTWEIMLKCSVGKLSLPYPPEEYVPLQRIKHGIECLPLDEEATYFLRKLPPIHSDPFDRMLVCQAITNKMCIMTPDSLIAKYPAEILW